MAPIAYWAMLPLATPAALVTVKAAGSQGAM